MSALHLAALLLAMAISAGGAPASPRPPVPESACFGAAARDPSRPCRDPQLLHLVVPSPAQARKLPNSPCAPVEHGAAMTVCGFGADPAAATRTVALVGDSHAGHWRAALDVVARARGWRGLSIAHTSCPLSKAVRNLEEPDRFRACVAWKRAVFAWFERHPEVGTVFVGGLTGGRGVIPPRGQSAFAASVRGYRRAWAALPATVRRIVVIRDTPKMRGDTGACVERALADDRQPGASCAVSRRAALDRDPMIVAAAGMRSDRVRTVKLTEFFCDRRRCYPVIGGALVLRDQNHLTAVFSTTLGRYLLRKVDALLAGWVS